MREERGHEGPPLKTRLRHMDPPLCNPSTVPPWFVPRGPRGFAGEITSTGRDEPVTSGRSWRDERDCETGEVVRPPEGQGDGRFLYVWGWKQRNDTSGTDWSIQGW